MRRGVLAAVLGGAAVAAAVGGGYVACGWRADDDRAAMQSASAAAPASAVARPPAAPAAPVADGGGAAAVPEQGDGLQRVPIAPVDTRAPAWVSMAQARDAGDERSPPIERGAPAERTDPALLADPEAYAANELAQKHRVAAAFVRAAGPEVARLQDDLERGRAAGIPPAELAKVAEKIRRIEQQRAAAAATLPDRKEP